MVVSVLIHINKSSPALRHEISCCLKAGGKNEKLNPRNRALCNKISPA